MNLTRTYQTTGQNQVPGRPSGFILADNVHVVTYGYDTQGRLNKVTGSGLHAAGVSYSFAEDTDLVEKISFNNSSGTAVSANFEYEPHRDLIQSVENKRDASPTPPISKYAYLNDEIGRRMSVVMTGEAFTGNGGDHHWRWGYNDRSEVTIIDRCIGVDLQAPCSLLSYENDYEYDPIGNRTMTSSGTTPPVFYETNNLNQYTQVTDNDLISESYDYDADGNLTHRGGAGAAIAYTWDAENRLIRVEPSDPWPGATKSLFDYDYMSRRVRKRVYAWDETLNGGAGDWKAEPQADLRFVYDAGPLTRRVSHGETSGWASPTAASQGWNVTLVLDGLDHDENGQPDNTVLTKYTWGLDLSGQRGNPTAGGIHGAGGIGGLLAVEETAESGTPKYWFLYDANGNVGEVVENTTGYPVAAHYEYDAYGNAIVVADLDSSEYVDANAFRFSTKWFETQSSLGYWGYRYYFPGTGRWLSRDPVQELGGLNIYGYAYNDVTNKIDYLGQVVPAIPLIVLGVKTYMTGSACSNAIQALYCCYLFCDCRTNAVIAAQAAMNLWDAQVEKENDPSKLADIYAKAKAQMNAANFGSECSELGRCCLKKGVKAIAWATSRYFVFKIEWIRK